MKMLPAILIGLITLTSLTLGFLASQTKALHEELVTSLEENSLKLKQRSQKLKNLEYRLKKHPQELDSGEMEHVRREIDKISKLWKSRRERLEMGLWEHRGKKAGEEEEVGEAREEDELSPLNHRKEQLKNLMQKTKIEYRKRKIDEVSFREIMRDYQKELMEIDIKISELESQNP